MLLALTAEEWILLASAVVPAILAVVVVVLGWRWAKREEAQHAAAEAPLEPDEPPVASGSPRLPF